MASHIDQLVDDVDEAMSTQITAEARLRALVHRFMAHYIGASDRQKVLLNELGSLPSARRATIVAKQRDPTGPLSARDIAEMALELLISGKADPITSEYSRLHWNSLARLSYLAPDIISSIVAGNYPPALNGRRLLRAANLPLDWDGQRRLLGFA
jgi:hypothetical protein